MTMTANRVVALCEQAAYWMREDLHLIDSGNLKVQLFGTDATQEHGDRIRARLAKLEEIVEGWGSRCD